MKSRSLFQQIVASWISIKPWVKNWLFFLNSLFLVSVVFLNDPATKWILLAYVASAPLLAWMMMVKHGITRLLGMAHLIPWLPLLGYLVLRLTTGLVGAQVLIERQPIFASYLYLLSANISLCLLLDVWDMVRYFKGERYVFGSPEAVRAGASKPFPDKLPCEFSA
jgi:hypothetical protein